MIETVYEISKKIVDKNDAVEEFNNPSKKMIVLFLILLLTILIGLLVLYIGKILWNNYLTKTVSGIKPVNSIFHFACIYLLVKILLVR